MIEREIPRPQPTDGDTAWFTESRFGMFIHWGLYAMGARHEWLKSQEQKTDSDYDRYFKRFDPDLYDPNRWAQAAADAGMKYFVVTSKHHEGFCLWDSKFTDYKATNTPAKRDLLKPMLEAFRNQGLKTGLYYSLLDWRHRDYTTDQHHPRREDQEFIARDGERNLSTYTDYLHSQVRELLTEYGGIDILWFDFSVAASEKFPGKGKDVWRSEELIRMIRSLQPKIILNDRLQIDQDLKTPEQFQPPEWVTVDGKPVVWEACQTFSGSWGYHRDETTWKPLDMLIRMLIDTVSKGGNLLLNVGPTGRGEFDERVLDRLEGIGKWMRHNSRSIYECTQAPFTPPTDVRYTYNPSAKRLYAHLFAYPYRHLILPGLKRRVAYAQFLHDASEVQILDSVPEFSYGGGVEVRLDEALILELPVIAPNQTVSVIELELA